MSRTTTIATSAALLTALLATSAIARGGMHSHSSLSMTTNSAAPSVPPSLTPDPRLTGSAPLPPAHEPNGGPNKGFEVAHDPQDAKMERMIANICRGC